MTLGEKITEARRQRGFTQEQLSERMMLSRSVIAKWESDAERPDVDDLKQLAQLLNVNVGYLFTDAETMSEPVRRELAPQNLPARPRQRIRPNGKRSFSARTVVYPIVFIVVHFLIQLLATVLAGISYLGSHLSDYLTDVTPELTPEMMQEMGQSIAIPMLLYGASLQIITYAIFLWYQKQNNPQYLLVRPTRATAFPLGLATAFGSLGITMLLIMLFEILAENSPFWQSMLSHYQRSTAGLQGTDLVLMTLGIAILIPLAEEFLFRGIITEEIRQVAPDWLAILLGGVIFALVHGNLVQILYVLPLGLLLSASYIWTNSIWVPVLIHVVFNFFGSIFGPLIGENETLQTVYTIFLIVMIPVGIFCTFIMKRMFQKDKKDCLKKSRENELAQM
jgi:membrane protease YdiL (CAAX protease family)/DNA-binding XRE family transcriptional regulator